MRGVKLHTWGTKYYISNEKNFNHISRVVKLIEALKLPIIIHGYFPKQPNEVKALLRLIKENPNVKFSIAHMLGRDIKLIKELKLKNFYVDISASIFWYLDKKDELLSTFRAIGIEKVMFGSDWPVFHPSEIVWALGEYDFTEDELEQMTEANALRFFQ